MPHDGWSSAVGSNVSAQRMDAVVIARGLGQRPGSAANRDHLGPETSEHTCCRPADSRACARDDNDFVLH
jgi:hypothetical protein